MVDFSDDVPAGTTAVRCSLYGTTADSVVYSRAAGDPNITNTPHASSEFHCQKFYAQAGGIMVQAVLWLSAAYQAEFAVHVNTCDLVVRYPAEYLL